jgi:hypothetical protein
MFVYTKIVFSMETLEVIDQEGFFYEGPVALCKGATSQEKNQQQAEADLAKKQASFFDTMTTSYGQMFAGQNAILSALKTAFQPILEAGPGQYGYTKAEDRALRTQASEGTGASYKMAKQAVAEGQAASGGDAFIPKGATAEVNAQLASTAAAQEAQQQLGITTQGYEIGRQNFGQAASALGGVAGMMNPTGYAGASTGAGSSAAGTGKDAFEMASTIQQQNAAASPWNIVGGVLGGALQTGLGVFTGGLSNIALAGLKGTQTPQAPVAGGSMGNEWGTGGPGVIP